MVSTGNRGCSACHRLYAEAPFAEPPGVLQNTALRAADAYAGASEDWPAISGALQLASVVVVAVFTASLLVQTHQIVSVARRKIVDSHQRLKASAR